VRTKKALRNTKVTNIISKPLYLSIYIKISLNITI